MFANFVFARVGVDDEIFFEGFQLRWFTFTIRCSGGRGCICLVVRLVVLPAICNAN